jgi:hypothetical protein
MWTDGTTYAGVSIISTQLMQLLCMKLRSESSAHWKCKQLHSMYDGTVFSNCYVHLIMTPFFTEWTE